MSRVQLGLLPDAPIGVAVSGGGDSVALLMLLHEAGHTTIAVTVNHQLRPEAAAEAQTVAALCAEYGIKHTVLRWEHDTLEGNLQNRAREARQTLLAGWAQAEGLGDIALGHTLDDQAETVLMRLARGSGVDGLAGMAAKRTVAGLSWHRPLLRVRRAVLRDYLQVRGIGWVDDPSNDDSKFDRIKARKALAHLAPLGLSAERLAETATHMRRARGALEDATLTLAQTCVAVNNAGELRLARAELAIAPAEIQLRLLSSALKWVASAGYRPRFLMLEGLLESCLSGAPFGKTLHGCKISGKGNNIVINRELAATPALAQVQPVWDGRWQISQKNTKNTQIKALGEDGLKACINWRDSGFSRESLLVSPSFWRQGALIAAPLAQFGQNVEVNLRDGEKGFYNTVKSH